MVSTNSKIWPDSTCAISVRRKGQILLEVESLVFSTTVNENKTLITGERNSSDFQCRMYDSYGTQIFSDYTPTVHVNSRFRGMVVVCPFDRKLACPSNVSITFDNQTLSQRVRVEHQLKRNLNNSCEPCKNEFRLVSILITSRQLKGQFHEVKHYHNKHNCRCLICNSLKFII